MWECGAMREDFPAEEVDGGRGALWAGAVLDEAVVVFIVVQKSRLVFNFQFPEWSNHVTFM